MGRGKGRGWHGDSAGHSAAARGRSGKKKGKGVRAQKTMSKKDKQLMRGLYKSSRRSGAGKSSSLKFARINYPATKALFNPSKIA